jgi:hypothetical protein
MVSVAKTIAIHKNHFTSDFFSCSRDLSYCNMEALEHDAKTAAVKIVSSMFK